MPTFFEFTQGLDNAASYQPDTEPLLGRFRAVPPRMPKPPFRRPQLGLLALEHHPGRRHQQTIDNRTFQQIATGGSVHAGYGAIVVPDISASDSSDDDDDDAEEGGTFASPFDDAQCGNVAAGDVEFMPGQTRKFALAISKSVKRGFRRLRRKIVNLYVQPQQGTVKRIMTKWYSRYFLMVFLPAIATIAWCAIPFPQYDIEWDDNEDDMGLFGALASRIFKPRPGHGEARVELNFWFFLIVFYGLYNVVALMWITKVFNIYNLNWWPKRMGFPLTLSLVVILGTVAPIPIYYNDNWEWITEHNTAWISWSFVIMAVPVMIAFMILTFNERHLGLRKSMSDTRRIFTSSWWTGDPETITHRESRRRDRGPIGSDFFDEPSDCELRAGRHVRNRRRGAVAMRKSWLPASFVRFIWFCMALIVGLLAYLLGETYVEIYLRTLPHNSWDTIVYVYSWVITIHLLDILTGWILGVREGERVGSYPLSWTFKLYFIITYQTYVRALYARLRSPSQFLWLQLMSSSFLIVLVPLTMHPLFYRALTILRLTTQSYPGYQKLCLRNVFIRTIAKNASMTAFLGSIAILHFGSNKDMYPYFAFDKPGEPYTFRLTYISSAVTWVCEVTAELIVRGVIRWGYGVDVDLEGKMDLIVWPELVPTSAAVTVHVLQNMMFSIVRLQFKR